MSLWGGGLDWMVVMSRILWGGGVVDWMKLVGGRGKIWWVVMTKGCGVVDGISRRVGGDDRSLWGRGVVDWIGLDGGSESRAKKNGQD